MKLATLLRGLAFLSPWLIGFLAFTLMPIALSLYYSFCDYSLLQPPLFTGLDELPHAARTTRSSGRRCGNTLVYAAAGAAAGDARGAGLAMLLNAKIRGQAVYRTIIFLPSLVPAVASAMLWLWLFNAEARADQHRAARASASTTRPAG